MLRDRENTTDKNVQQDKWRMHITIAIVSQIVIVILK